MLKSLLKREQGFVLLPLALAAMVVGSLLVTSFLIHAATATRAIQTGQDLGAEQTSASAGIEHALWRLQYEDGFADSLTPESPTVTYDITVDGETIPITVTRVYPEGYQSPESDPTPTKDVTITKDVTPETADAGHLTTYTYTITIENIGLESYTIKDIQDQLPPGLSYVGPTSGLTTSDPQEEHVADLDIWLLRWRNLNISIQPSQVMTLTFNARGSLEAGTYYNYATVQESGSGDYCRASGPTAPIEVDATPSSPQSQVLDITKTVEPDSAAAFDGTPFTYTISLVASSPENDVGVAKIFDRLPRNFDYVPGSTTSNFGYSDDPSITEENNRQTLVWTGLIGLASGVGTIPKTLSFQAIANGNKGTHSNKVWVKMVDDQLQTLSCGGTGDTAPVELIAEYDVLVAVGDVTIRATVGQSSDGVAIQSWQVD